MKRLTERTSGGILVKEDYGDKVLKTLYQCFGAEVMLHHENCDEGYCAVEKLAEYEDLEEQGLLLKLPCKEGTAVYSLDKYCGGYTSDCPSRPCKSCEDYQFQIYKDTFKLKDIKDFGKTVFLTREEAEEALKRMGE